MHSSWFSYPVSRPYPFRWFTPVTIAGGIVLAVLFTLINLGSSGFYLKSKFTQDPNSTIASGTQWFMKPPFTWEHNLEPKCEPKILSVGDSFFTTTLGFQYTIKSLSRSNDDGEIVESFSSIPYMNNPLEHCFLNQASLKLRKTDATADPTWWISWSTSYVSAAASCSVMSQLGPVNISLGLQYSGVIQHHYGYVLDSNYTTHASMWWGTRLLNAYLAGAWEIMSRKQRVPEGGDDNYWVIGGIPYVRDLSQNDIRSLDFFSIEAWLASSLGQIENRDGKSVSYLFEHPEHPASAVVAEGLHFSKLLHSLVSIDLGNCHAPNLFLDEDNLKYAIDAPESPNRKPGKPLHYKTGGASAHRNLYTSIPGPGLTDKDEQTLLHQVYGKFRPLTGKLGCQNSTIVAQYLCSVPQSKSTGTMLLAIVIANLVFLQAAWKLMGLVAQGMLPKVDPQSMVCEGCLKGDYAMEHLSSGTRPGSRRSGTGSGDESAAHLITR